MASSPTLHARELEVLQCFLTGMSHGEIAGKLFISPKTVSVHMFNIRAKIGKDVDTDVRLYRWATEHTKELRSNP